MNVSLAKRQSTPIPAEGAGLKGAQPSVRHEDGPIVALLRLEGDTRAAKTIDELIRLIANETKKITRAKQAFVVRPDASGKMRIAAISALAEVDSNVPFVQWLEGCLGRLAAGAGLSALREFSLKLEADTTTDRYPFTEALWFPLQAQDGKTFAGVLLTRDDPWTSAETTLVQRLALTYAQTWYWLATSKPFLPRLVFDRKKAAIGAAVTLAIAIFPVSMTTLAPLEIVPHDQTLVTAPMDGVIEDIPIASSGTVAVGDVLVKFADTALRNRLEVAEREAQVADARMKKTMLMAVTDPRGRHEMALARAELTVKIAERNFARDMMSRTVLRATRPGLAIFGDKRELIGRPISTGERIMEIADPANVEVRIDVPISDAIILNGDKRAKLFLDSSPLQPREAVVIRSDYQAKPYEGGTVAFRSAAKLVEDGTPPPRLGLRGTAQLYGARVPIVYYVLRRPLTALRQWTGL